MDIVLNHVSKFFGEKKIFEDFSMSFPAGKITGIMAPSGFGKTTLLRMLMGLCKPDKGEIWGIDRKKSAVFQEDRLCQNLSALTNIRLTNPKLTREEIERAMEAVGLDLCAGQPVRELSGGMKRRIAILRALLSEYEILFLDEPFKGLDQETKELVMADTKRRCQGKTVILVTHDMQELKAMEAQTVRLDSIPA